MSDLKSQLLAARLRAKQAKTKPPTTRGGALALGVAQGATMGFADEIFGAVQGSRADMAANGLNPQSPVSHLDALNSGVPVETRGPSPEYTAAADQATSQARRVMHAHQEAFPGTSTVGEIGGALVSPAAKLAPAVSTARGAATVGASYSAAEGVGNSQGNLVDRLPDAAMGAGLGFITGGLTAAAGQKVHKLVKGAFKKAETRPSMETLKTAKNAAYAAVRKSGVEFGGDDLLALRNRVERQARNMSGVEAVDFDPDIDKGAIRALKIIQRDTGRDSISLNRLDKTRQSLWALYKREDHPFILKAIGEIDATIERAAEGNDILKAAREANSRHAKAQLLDNAFWKAELQTAGTGSGGNILNKYRQAVTRILTGSEARFFTEQERALMEQFVRGDLSENIFRRAGKLAPGGNGLMTALNVYGASVDPSLLAITAVATAAKNKADNGAMKGADDLLSTMATGGTPAVERSATKALGVSGAVAAGNFLR